MQADPSKAFPHACMAGSKVSTPGGPVACFITSKAVQAGVADLCSVSVEWMLKLSAGSKWRF